MGVRELRLEADHEAMVGFHSRVLSWTICGDSDPPDTYRITYLLRSIVGFKNGTPIYRSRHEVDISLPEEYPRRPPIVNLVTRPYVLHPNIYTSGRFCIEDRWRPVGMYLDTVCELVGQLIAYQKMNLRSAANRDSQLLAWLDANQGNPDLVPTDPSQIRLPDPLESIVWGFEAEPRPGRQEPPAPRQRIEW